MIKSLAHMLLGAMFITGGANVLKEPGGRVQKVEKAGIPNPREATILNGTIMVIAGSALALDIAPKLAALTLIGSLIPTTWVGHRFWEEQDPVARAGQQTQFFKNLAMIGGLLLVLTEKNDA
jgi:putative oxidoreductase